MYVQDPYLKSEEYGQTIDEVENLIKKHEAFEKAAAAQEERFAALERLTTVRHWFGLVVSVPANPWFEYRSWVSPQGGLRGGRSLCEYYCTMYI